MKHNTKLVFLMLMLVFVLLLPACNKIETGITGQVFLAECTGPDVAQGCTSTEPYQAILTVYDSSVVMLLTVETKSDGTFVIPLEAGTYYIHPQSDGNFPIASDYQVVVTDGEVVELTINYDTGIR